MLELSWRRVGAVMTRPGVIVDRLSLDKTSKAFTKTLSFHLFSIFSGFQYARVSSSLGNEFSERLGNILAHLGGASAPSWPALAHTGASGEHFWRR